MLDLAHLFKPVYRERTLMRNLMDVQGQGDQPTSDTHKASPHEHLVLKHNPSDTHTHTGFRQCHGAETVGGSADWGGIMKLGTLISICKANDFLAQLAPRLKDKLN